MEERAARRAGLLAVRVGLGALAAAPPPGPLVSFGLAGALVPGLPPGTVVTAARVVDEHGATLWQGEPLSACGAREVALLGASAIVDEPAERAALAAASGAEAVDLETAALAATGRLTGVLRAVSDTPDRPLGRLAAAATHDGDTDAAAVVRAFALEPLATARAALTARRALRALESAARALAAR